MSNHQLVIRRNSYPVSYVKISNITRCSSVLKGHSLVQDTPKVGVGPREGDRDWTINNHATTAEWNPRLQTSIVFCALPGVRAGHTLGVDIVTQLLSTVVYPRPDVDLEQPPEQQTYMQASRLRKIIYIAFTLVKQEQRKTCLNKTA